MTSVELFENSLEWLKNHYSKFYHERDIVYVLQKYINKLIKKHSLTYRVYNDYPIKVFGKRLLADLVIESNNLKGKKIDIAAEFKYEPDHERKDILESKLNPSVVFWSGKYSVAEDIEKARKYVRNQANHTYSIFIDEGRRFYLNKHYNKKQYKDSKWIEWGKKAVLIARFPK